MDNKKSFCASCQKEVSNETEKCECGGHSFAFGDLKVVDKKIVCKCGKDSFRRGMHMDYTNKATTTLICNECGNVCGTEYFRDKHDMMFWGYDCDDENPNNKYLKRIINRQRLFNKRKSLGRSM